MAVTALAQEKVWIEKSAYDKAECLYFERLAKVASHSIGKLDSYVCKSLISTDPQEIITTNVTPNTKSSSKKSKEKKNKADKKNKSTIELGHEATANKRDQVSSQGSGESTCSNVPASGSLANEVAKARQHIKKGLQCVDNISSGSSVPPQDVSARFAHLEKDNQELRAIVKELSNKISELTSIVDKLEKKVNESYPAPYIAVCPAKPSSTKGAVSIATEDDDVDLFGSDSEGEDAEAARVREERLAAYAAKKSKKPALIAKSNIIFDVKPWDDETDMKAMETEVRKITSDGLLWGAAKLVPLAFGINKLQISCVLEDDKVSVDWLQEKVEELEDLVQSVDIAAFNKV